MSLRFMAVHRYLSNGALLVGSGKLLMRWRNRMMERYTPGGLVAYVLTLLCAKIAQSKLICGQWLEAIICTECAEDLDT